MKNNTFLFLNIVVALGLVLQACGRTKGLSVFAKAAEDAKALRAVVPAADPAAQTVKMVYHKNVVTVPSVMSLNRPPGIPFYAPVPTYEVGKPCKAGGAPEWAYQDEVAKRDANLALAKARIAKFKTCGPVYESYMKHFENVIAANYGWDGDQNENQNKVNGGSFPVLVFKGTDGKYTDAGLTNAKNDKEFCQTAMFATDAEWWGCSTVICRTATGCAN